MTQPKRHEAIHLELVDATWKREKRIACPVTCRSPMKKNNATTIAEIMYRSKYRHNSSSPRNIRQRPVKNLNSTARLIPEKTMNSVTTHIEFADMDAKPASCVMKPPVETVLMAILRESTKLLPHIIRMVNSNVVMPMYIVHIRITLSDMRG